MPDSLLTDTIAAARMTIAADTAATDTAARDSAAIQRIAIPRLPWSATCPASAAPALDSDSIYSLTIATDWLTGIDGTPRPVRPGYDSGVLTLLLGSFLIVAIGFRQGARLWKSLIHDLFDVRRRSNAFDERTTGETWVICVMVLQTCIYTGLLCYAWLGMQEPAGGTKPVFTAVAAMTAVAVALYVFRLCGYWVTGYAFTDHTGRIQWVRGFNASQILLGWMLMLPALGATFYPNESTAMFIAATVVYAVAETVFICKGFRIFYHHFDSLLYFILYFCTLEIIPLILAYHAAVSLYRLMC